MNNIEKDQPESESLQVVTPSELEALERAQVDIQIATAHKYRRPALSAIKKEIISFATLDEETAEGCFYSFNRGGKDIRGPSIRLAEMAMTCYGNLNAGAREIANDGKNITVQAVCHDLERNVRICIEVKRKITDKNGKTFSEDMQTVTGNAARSIALRNAIFKVVPMALIRPAYNEARKTAVGDASTLADRRNRAMDTFAKMGASKERVLASIGKPSVEDIDLAALEALQGVRTAIQDGDTTVDEAFPAPIASKPLFAKTAPKPEEDKPKGEPLKSTATEDAATSKPAGHGEATDREATTEVKVVPLALIRPAYNEARKP
jgi:hypothetical protein